MPLLVRTLSPCCPIPFLYGVTLMAQSSKTKSRSASNALWCQNSPSVYFQGLATKIVHLQAMLEPEVDSTQALALCREKLRSARLVGGTTMAIVNAQGKQIAIVVINAPILQGSPVKLILIREPISHNQSSKLLLVALFPC